MLYCFAQSESIERILERDFVQTGRTEDAEVSKHAGDVFVYRHGAPANTTGGEERICAGGHWYALRNAVITPPALVRTVELRFHEYVSPATASAPVYEDAEFTAALAPALRFTVGRASSNGRRLGTFLVPCNRRTRLALRDLLKKHEIVENEPGETVEEDLVALLVQLKKF